MVKLFGFFMLFFLAGCNELKRKKSFDPIWENKVVTSRLFLTPAQEDVVYHFEITGVESKNEFSKEYRKVARSNWMDRDCSFGPHGNICVKVPKRNKCSLYYRDFIERTTSLIDFSKVEKWPFKLMIGKKTYPLDNDFIISDKTLYAKLTVSKEMLEDGYDIDFVVIQEEPETVKVGFQRFGKCSNREHDFKVYASLSSEVMNVDNVREVSVTMIRESRDE